MYSITKIHTIVERRRKRGEDNVSRFVTNLQILNEWKKQRIIAIKQAKIDYEQNAKLEYRLFQEKVFKNIVPILCCR